MRTQVSLLLIVILLMGCSQLNFKKASESGVGGNKVGLVLLENGWRGYEKSKPVSDIVNGDPELLKSISAQCRIPPTDGDAPAAAALLPIISAIGKLVFDLSIDAQLRALEELKAAGQATYSERFIIPADVFKKKRCALLVRYNEKTNAPGLLALMVIEAKGPAAFVISPRYIRAHNARAVTRDTKGEDSGPKINVSIAVATKLLGKHRTGVVALLPAGEGAVSVSNVAIGAAANSYQCREGCPSSDLVPYPDGSQIMSLSIAITETGDIGFDIDQASAELKAIKEALGPAFSEALQEALKKKE